MLFSKRMLAAFLATANASGTREPASAAERKEMEDRRKAISIKLEAEFADKVKATQYYKDKEREARDLDENVKKTRFPDLDLTLFPQTYDEVNERVPKGTGIKLRVVQMNVLAHGLSGPGGGFAANYDRALVIEAGDKMNEESTEEDDTYPTIAGFPNDIEELIEKLLKNYDINWSDGTARNKIDQGDGESVARVFEKMLNKKFEDTKTSKRSKLIKMEKGGNLTHEQVYVQDRMENWFPKIVEMKFQPGHEIISPAEKKFLKPQDIRELLFNKTWGSVGERPAFPPRFKRIAGMILKDNPDIINMQELDHFEEMRKFLAVYGYDGVWNQKKPNNIVKDTGGNIRKFEVQCEDVGNWVEDAKGKKTPTRKYNGCERLQNDGVAIFWNTLRLEAEEDPQRVWLDKGGSQIAMFQKLRILESKDTKNPYLVAVTGHFKSGKKPGDVATKVKHAAKIAKIINSDKYRNERIIFGTDFNSSKDSKAFRKFKKDAMMPSKQRQSRSNFRRSRDMPNNALSSAYTPVKKENIEGQMTNKNSAMKCRGGGQQPDKIGELDDHTIDFIFYSHKHWAVASKLSLPSFHEVNSATGGTKRWNAPQSGFKTWGWDEQKQLGSLLPCMKYPSDHFKIGTDLVLIA